MSRSPRVSVCVTSYNHERFIGPAIQSVLDQDFQDFEIVVVDDASVDASCAVIESFTDPRIRLHRNEENVGSTLTFRKALENSQGEFVAILASDDLYMAGKLSAQIAVFDENPSIGAVFSNVQPVDEDGNNVEHAVLDGRFLQRNRPKSEWLRLMFLEGNFLAAPSAVMRRSVMDEIGPHNPLLMQAPDFEYWIRLCMKHEIHVLPEKLAGHRIHADQSNLSAATPDRQARVFWEWIKLLDAYRSIDDEAYMRRIFPEARPERLGSLPVSTLLIEPALQSSIPPVQAFGLNVLQGILSNEARAAEMHSHGLGRNYLFKKSGELDLFGIRSIPALYSEIRDLTFKVHEFQLSRDHLSIEADGLRRARSEWAAETARLAAAAAEAEGLRSSTAQLTAELAECRSAGALMHSDNETLRASNDALVLQAGELRATRQALSERIEAKEGTVAELQAMRAAPARSWGGRIKRIVGRVSGAGVGS